MNRFYSKVESHHRVSSSISSLTVASGGSRVGWDCTIHVDGLRIHFDHFLPLYLILILCPLPRTIPPNWSFFWIDFQKNGILIFFLRPPLQNFLRLLLLRGFEWKVPLIVNICPPNLAVFVPPYPNCRNHLHVWSWRKGRKGEMDWWVAVSFEMGCYRLEEERRRWAWKSHEYKARENACEGVRICMLSCRNGGILEKKLKAGAHLWRLFHVCWLCVLVRCIVRC